MALLALIIYRATLLPGLGVWDTAEAQTAPPLLGTMHPTGFPAYVVLGRLATLALAPFGSPALRMNLLSALLVAAAVVGLLAVVRQLGGNLVVAIGVAVGFALTPIVWAIALAADVHALHLALVALLTICLLRWESLVHGRRGHPGRGSRNGSDQARVDRALVLAAVVFGVSVANHALTLLLLPAVIAYVLAVDRSVLSRSRTVLAAVGGSLAVATVLYLELPLRAGPFRAPLVYGHPETLTGFLDVVLGRQFAGGASGLLSDPVGALLSPFGIAVAQLGPLALLIPVGLAVTVVRRPHYALLSGLATAVTCVFALSYDNAAIGRYYLGPAFFAWTWIAVLAMAVVDWAGGPPAAPRSEVPGGDVPSASPHYRTMLSLALMVILLVPTTTSLPTRWPDVDRSGDTQASVWLDEAFDAMAPRALVLSWWSYSTPMWYGQLVDDRRPDIAIVDDRTRLDEHLGSVADVIDANVDTRPVYVIRVQASEVQALGDRFVIEPVGRPDNLYRVIGRQETYP